MMRRTICIALIFAMALFLSSCAKDNSVDPNALMQSINDEFTITDMTTVTSADELYTLFLLNDEDIPRFAAEYSAESDTRGEIIIVEAKDKNSAFSVKTTLYNRLDSFLSNSKSYSPEEYAILEKCSVNVYQDIYVTLVIRENAEEIDRYIEEKLS